MAHSICILGGGFGGLYTALALSKLDWKDTPHEIVLIDQRDRFVFAPLLYELVTGELQTWEIAPPYEELIANTGIRFHRSGVDSIDIDAQTVDLTDGKSLSYDRIVLALGGETPMDMAPGVAEHAIPFRTLADAYRLKDRLRQLEAANLEKIRVAIVGGGYSGVEIACKVAERLGDKGRVRIVERANQILQTSPEFNQKAALDALDEKNVWIDYETTVTEVTANSFSLSYKDKVDTLPVDIVLWTVGSKVSPALDALNLPRNERGQFTISPTLQVIDYPHIFALGDLADGPDADGKPVPPTAQSALQQADYAAWNIWASLTDRPLLPFRYQHLGEMMTLGTDNATLSGLGIKLEGNLAYVARRLTYLYRMPTLDHQIRVGVNWLTQPVQALLTGSNK
ncbi:NAD(P)/FAD-dependent oxidoreductase [cf. Phormidesmis sp. LEGE 11477]|uniref:NAD(P)/FAD-dependent oxidoreductase n=1 Tax=cf. Phormidesmis sp. LEGE 11477 TaxID=1828680 RepID=UPI0018812B2D|nr:NAD(P)/FAD-dependent oxidoreductase [cf. Phormidesmis sp. LEGE 11477]MBE9064631.1 NAD(P)/FAD-dependent oxidoreductase [cf. Phormidesmis sp. LEGE 11477]